MIRRRLVRILCVGLAATLVAGTGTPVRAEPARSWVQPSSVATSAGVAVWRVRTAR